MDAGERPRAEAVGHVMQVLLLREAEEELEAAARWYEQKRAGLGVAFMAAGTGRETEHPPIPCRFHVPAHAR
jgi:hypothetical protein